MTSEQKSIKDWMLAFGQECPEKPGIPSLEIRKLRAKLILEEALELIDALGFDILTEIGHTLPNQLYEFVETEHGPDMIEIADGCSDLKVVTEGTLVACGLAYQCCEDNCNKVDPLFNEVMRSNFSKMWKYSELGTAEEAGYDVQLIPIEDQCVIEKTQVGNLYIGTIAPAQTDPRMYLVKDKDGKVIKSPSYSPANLTPIIEEMKK